MLRSKEFGPAASFAGLLLCCLPAAAAHDRPDNLHWEAWTSFPADDLWQEARHSQAIHLPESKGCSTLDGPHCTHVLKESLSNRLNDGPKKTKGKQGERDLKIKFITLKTKPGQTMDEALQQALEQEMERMRLSAEEAALRQGKTLKEARKAGEEAAAKVKSEPAIEAKDMDELIQGLMGILSDFVGENPEELVDQLLLQGKDSGKGSNEDDEYVDKGIADHQDDNSVTDDEYLDPHEEL